MICVIVGKSGSGKSTVERILEGAGLKRIISSTSRPKRKDEVDEEDYVFRTTQDLLNKAAEGRLIEYQFIGGELYGIEESQFRKGEQNVAVVGVEGLRALEALDDVKIMSFYLKVPAFTRFKRMVKRRDGIFKIIKRIRLDPKLFKGIESEVDYIIDGSKGPGYVSTEISRKLREWDN